MLARRRHNGHCRPRRYHSRSRNGSRHPAGAWRVTRAGRTVPAPPGTAPAPPGAAPAPPAVVPAPPSARAPNTHRASPAARREAAALGIDLAAVAGTGPAGAVTLDDVHAAASSAAKPVVTERAEQMRRSIAAAMSRSKREIPHYYLSEEVILDGALAWLTERNAHRSVTERLLPAVLQLKAVALAAHRFGELNGFWRNAGFESATAVHLGVAISLRSGGLVAPAIHDAAVKPLDELMPDLTDLVARARAGCLRSSEMSDPTITVTNLGDQGIDAVFGVIYPPQVALVGFGKPAQRACVIDGEVRPLHRDRHAGSADHRASDGHCGALFLAEIANLLQQPEKL